MDTVRVNGVLSQVDRLRVEADDLHETKLQFEKGFKICTARLAAALKELDSPK
jgi:hypothetical protein